MKIDIPNIDSPCVYVIEIGDYYYFGSTKNLARRMSDHISTILIGRHYNKILLKEFKKCSELNFRILNILKTRDEAYEMEQKYLDEHFGKEFCANQNPSATKYMKKCHFCEKYIEQEKFLEHVNVQCSERTEEKVEQRKQEFEQRKQERIERDKKMRQQNAEKAKLTMSKKPMLVCPKCGKEGKVGTGIHIHIKRCKFGDETK